MSFVILGELFTFPEGNAATNRVYNYAKGFIENGINSYVICFRDEYTPIKMGVSQGVKYFIPFSPVKKSDSFFLKVWFKVSKYINTARILRQINKKDPVIAINCYSRLFTTRLFSYFLAKLCRAKLVFESSEHPLQYEDRSHFYNRIKVDVELFIGLYLADGILCISNYLVEFYKNRGIKQKKLCIVPSTVDTTRFINNEPSPLPFQYIVYCGGLSILKDGVNVLIRSFAAISPRYPDLSLVLIGKGDSKNEEEVLKQLALKLRVEKSVFFLGQIPRNDIPKYLNHAKILALARPTSIIADAGFPSKLTEYLATGIPVVVTEVGEIPNYLFDNETAFLSKPDSNIAFANKLDEVLADYTHAMEVGQRGKQLTNTVFNYTYQAKQVIEFIKSL